MPEKGLTHLPSIASRNGGLLAIRRLRAGTAVTLPVGLDAAKMVIIVCTIAHRQDLHGIDQVMKMHTVNV